MCGASVSRFIGGRRLLRLECRAFRPPNDMKKLLMSNTKRIPPAYVGFGMLTPVTIMVLDRLPRQHGALVREFSEFVFDDAAIIACALRQWGVLTGMIGQPSVMTRAVMRLPIS